MKRASYHHKVGFAGLVTTLLLAFLLQHPSKSLCQTEKPESSFGEMGAVLPAFDVVSIKESNPDQTNTSFDSDPAGINISGARLFDLLREAYGLYDATGDQILGLPVWAKRKRFDIQAKVSEADLPRIRRLSREQSGAMLRGILVDRFQLIAREETRILPTYDLVLAKTGSKLAKTNADIPSPQTAKTSGCYAGCMSSDARHLDAKGVGFSSLAGSLALKTGRPVTDKTGLTGAYDFALDWSTDEGLSGAAISTSQSPPLIVAIEEQLGVKLQASKGPVKVIVIGSVSLPSAN